MSFVKKRMLDFLSERLVLVLSEKNPNTKKIFIKKKVKSLRPLLNIYLDNMFFLEIEDVSKEGAITEDRKSKRFGQLIRLERTEDEREFVIADCKDMKFIKDIVPPEDYDEEN